MHRCCDVAEASVLKAPQRVGTYCRMRKVIKTAGDFLRESWKINSQDKSGSRDFAPMLPPLDPIDVSHTLALKIRN